MHTSELITPLVIFQQGSCLRLFKQRETIFLASIRNGSGRIERRNNQATFEI
jgi:hypothetical protein